MTQRLNDTTRLNSLDGLRGFAVLLVFVVHFAQFALEKKYALLPWEQSIYSFTFYYGQTGVDLFFALSGYLIYDALIRQKFDTREYIKRRTFRIYPVFLFILAIYSTAALLGFHKEKAAELGSNLWQISSYLFLNILLIPLMPTAFGITPLITATWSLAYEMLFYLVGPLITRPTGFYKLSTKNRLFIIIIFTIIAQLLMVYTNGFARPLMFLSGIIVSELSRKMQYRCPSGLGVFALFLSPLIVVIFPPAHRFPAIEVFLLYGLLLYETVTPGTLANRIFSNSLLCRIGIISYSLYLCHTLILRIYFRYVPSAIDFPIIFNLAPALIIVCCVAWLMYRTIEAPFISLTHKEKLDIPRASLSV